jgi:GntR family transcriptional repressor for pyruvate dehydrogenase complex
MHPSPIAVPEAAFQAIRKLIAEQGYGPGDSLPSQRDLAVRLGVSRASLREALSSLSALGRGQRAAGERRIRSGDF